MVRGTAHQIPLFPAARLLIVVLAVFWSAAGVHGQAVDDLVSWTGRVQTEEDRPVEQIRIALRGEIGDGWKMYAMDSPRPSRGVEITAASLPDGIRIAEVRQAEAKQSFDPNFQIDVTYFTEVAEFTVDLDAPAGLDPSGLTGTLASHAADRAGRAGRLGGTPACGRLPDGRRRE
jgi:thiol:disulfide interchange protein DsbD